MRSFRQNVIGIEMVKSCQTCSPKTQKWWKQSMIQRYINYQGPLLLLLFNWVNAKASIFFLFYKSIYKAFHSLLRLKSEKTSMIVRYTRYQSPLILLLFSSDDATASIIIFSKCNFTAFYWHTNSLRLTYLKPN